MSTDTRARQNADAPLDFEPVPESWIAGGTTNPTRWEDHRLYYAALAAVDERTMEVAVLYVERWGRGALVRRLDAAAVDDGYVPESVRDYGARTFQTVLSCDPSEEETDVSPEAWRAAVERYPRISADDRRTGAEGDD